MIYIRKSIKKDMFIVTLVAFVLMFGLYYLNAKVKGGETADVFLSSSVQSKVVPEFNERIFYWASGTEAIFDYDFNDGKYHYKKWSQNGFEPGEFYVLKTFEYRNLLVHVGNREINESTRKRQTIFRNNLGEVEEAVTLPGFGTLNCYYVHGNTMYFDEYISDNSNGNNNIGVYKIWSIDLDSKNIDLVCEYVEVFSRGKFVIREDGAIAMSLTKYNGSSKIVTYENGGFETIFERRWTRLLEFNNQGVFFLTPIESDEQLLGYASDVDVDGYRLVFKSKDGVENIILSSTLRPIVFLLFDDYFVIKGFFDSYIELYNLAGKLIKQVKLKEWPNLGRFVYHGSEVVYHDGLLKHLYYRLDTGELMLDIIDLGF